MSDYEYKVVPSPSKGKKGHGIKGAEARFSHALELLLNEMAAEGWIYHRSDILPSSERQGLTSSHTVYRSVLIFRRDADPPREPEIAAPAPIMAAENTPEIAATVTEGIKEVEDNEMLTESRAEENLTKDD